MFFIFSTCVSLVSASTTPSWRWPPPNSDTSPPSLAYCNGNFENPRTLFFKLCLIWILLSTVQRVQSFIGRWPKTWIKGCGHSHNQYAYIVQDHTVLALGEELALICSTLTHARSNGILDLISKMCLWSLIWAPNVVLTCKRKLWRVIFSTFIHVGMGINTSCYHKIR